MSIACRTSVAPEEHPPILCASSVGRGASRRWVHTMKASIAIWWSSLHSMYPSLSGCMTSPCGLRSRRRGSSAERLASPCVACCTQKSGPGAGAPGTLPAPRDARSCDRSGTHEAALRAQLNRLDVFTGSCAIGGGPSRPRRWPAYPRCVEPGYLRRLRRTTRGEACNKCLAP
eukprot:scaffold1410_cov386-Prasinococcus_capsulatus_cf.AAC.13